MKVLKRDKSVENFQIEKVKDAVDAAFKSCNVDSQADDVLDCIKSTYNVDSDDVVSIEDIQDNIEKCLMQSYPEVAKAYIIYRYSHKLLRDSKNKLVRQIRKKLTAEDVQNQNANVDEFSFGGRMGEANRVVTKEYALENCMSRKSRKNHENNEIYIHKLKIVA